MLSAMYLMELVAEILQQGGYTIEYTGPRTMLYWRKYPQEVVNLEFDENSIIMAIEVTNNTHRLPTDIDTVMSILKHYSNWKGAFIDSIETIRTITIPEKDITATVYERQLWRKSYADLSQTALTATLGYALLSGILLRERFIEAVRSCWDSRLGEINLSFLRSPICNNEDFFIDSIGNKIGLIGNRVTGLILPYTDNKFYLAATGRITNDQIHGKHLKLSDSFMCGDGKMILDICNDIIERVGYVARFEIVNRVDNYLMFDALHRVERHACDNEQELRRMDQIQLYLALVLEPISRFSKFPINLTTAIANVSIVMGEFQTLLSLAELAEIGSMMPSVEERAPVENFVMVSNIKS